MIRVGHRVATNAWRNSLSEQRFPLPALATPRNIALALIVIAWVLVAAVSWPGHLSYDSVTQLDEGRNLRFWTFHPPVMALLIGLFDRILPGTGLYMVLVQAFFFGALLILIATEKRVGWAGPVAVAAVMITPLVFDYQAIIWKDVLAANLSLFAFVGLYLARGRSLPVRFAVYGIGIFLTAIGAAARQNAGIALIVFLCAIVWIEGPFGESARHRLSQLVVAAASGIVLVALAWIATNAIVSGVERAPRTGPGLEHGIKVLMLYDVAGMLSHKPDFDLSFAAGRGVDIGALKKTARESYTPHHSDYLSDAYFAAAGKLSPRDLTYRRGGFWRIDERPGFAFAPSEPAKEWDGTIVDRGDFEARHPQDFVRGRRDDTSVPDPRPEPDIDQAAPAGRSSWSSTTATAPLNPHRGRRHPHLRRRGPTLTERSLMATSGTSTFTRTRDQIIADAARKIRAIRAGETMNARMLPTSTEALNAMVKALAGARAACLDGRRGDAFPAGRADPLRACRNRRGPCDAFLCGDRARGRGRRRDQHHARRYDGIAASDHIGIVLDDGTLHLDDGERRAGVHRVALDNALTGAAASGNAVYAYTSKIVRPLKIVDARRYDVSSREISARPPMARLDYRALPNKTQQGTVTQVYYDPGLNEGS
jgi:hypothetical protein